MHHMFVISYSFVVLLITTWLFRTSAGSLSPTRLNMLSFVFWFDILLLTFVGVILVALRIDYIFGWSFWGITDVVSQRVRFEGWFWTVTAILLFAGGVKIGQRVDILRLVKLASARTGCSQPSRRLPATRVLLLGAVVVSTIATVYMYQTIGRVLLFEVLSGIQSDVLSIARNDAGLRFAGNVYIKDYLAVQLSALTAYSSFALWLRTKRKRDAVLAILAGFLAWFALAHNMAKAPLVLFFVPYFVIRGLANRPISRFSLVVAFGVFSIAMVFLFDQLATQSSFQRAVRAFFERVFVAQTTATFLSLEWIPEIVPHAWFQPIFGRFGFGVDNPIANSSTARLLMEILVPKDVESGQAGLIVGFFIYESWALFSFFGLVVAPLWVGLFVGSVHRTIYPRTEDPLIAGFYGLMTINLSITGGFLQFFTMSKFTYMFIVFFVVWIGRTILERAVEPRAVPLVR